MKDALGNPASPEIIDQLRKNALVVMDSVLAGARDLVKKRKLWKLGEFMASAGNEFIGQSPGRKHWACTRGCSYCCSLGVPITPPEAFFIARTLRAQCSADELAELKIALEDRSKRANATTGAADYNRANIRCAFLTEDQSCGIHDFRPIACKAYASFDRDSCRAFAEHGPGTGHGIVSDEVARLMGSAVLTAFVEALTQAHLDGEFYELHGAMLVAFRDGAEAEWEKGRRVFRDCPAYAPPTPTE